MKEGLRGRGKEASDILTAGSSLASLVDIRLSV